MPKDMPEEKLSCSSSTDSKLHQVVTQIRSLEVPSSRINLTKEWNFERGIGIFGFGTCFNTSRTQNDKKHANKDIP